MDPILFPTKKAPPPTPNLLDLFAPTPDEPVTPSVPAPQVPTIEERFEAFHLRNPHVYDALEQLARRRLREGATYITIAQLYEELRADPSFSTTGDPLKINNSYRSYYARLLIQRVPALKDVMRTRDLRAKGAA